MRVHNDPCVTVHITVKNSPTGALNCPKSYLCILSNPLLSAILQVFNFTVGVKVEQHSPPLGKAEQDMTKLCNHRRKVVAMAALCRSMQASQLPYANLHHPGKHICCSASCRKCSS